MWLSLIRTASSSPKRWFTPPPARTAYFSKARSPGVVFRVQHTRASVWAIVCAICAVALAIPLIWLKKFSARSEEHTSELQSRGHLVCRLLLEKKKKTKRTRTKTKKRQPMNPGEQRAVPIATETQH